MYRLNPVHVKLGKRARRGVAAKAAKQAVKTVAKPKAEREKDAE